MSTSGSVPPEAAWCEACGTALIRLTYIDPPSAPEADGGDARPELKCPSCGARSRWSDHDRWAGVARPNDG